MLGLVMDVIACESSRSLPFCSEAANSTLLRNNTLLRNSTLLRKVGMFLSNCEVSQAVRRSCDHLKSAGCYLRRLQLSCSHTTRFAHCSLTAADLTAANSEAIRAIDCSFLYSLCGNFIRISWNTAINLDDLLDVFQTSGRCPSVTGI
jgi:hypothetical protein